MVQTCVYQWFVPISRVALIMKVITLREYPHLAVPVNKIDWIAWREVEEMRSMVCVGTGMTGHTIDFETIDQGMALYDKVIRLIEHN